MKLHRWRDIPREQMNPQFARQVLHSERITVARVWLAKGSVVPEHCHENEQLTVLEQGRLRFVAGGQEQILSAGEVMQLPPNLPHQVEALEDSVALDLFAPVREDWIRGEDGYLRR